jgi:hypothetical protein
MTNTCRYRRARAPPQSQRNDGTCRTDDRLIDAGFGFDCRLGTPVGMVLNSWKQFHAAAQT